MPDAELLEGGWSEPAAADAVFNNKQGHGISQNIQNKIVTIFFTVKVMVAYFKYYHKRQSSSKRTECDIVFHHLNITQVLCEPDSYTVYKVSCASVYLISQPHQQRGGQRRRHVLMQGGQQHASHSCDWFLRRVNQLNYITNKIFFM